MRISEMLVLTKILEFTITFVKLTPGFNFNVIMTFSSWGFKIVVLKLLSYNIKFNESHRKHLKMVYLKVILSVWCKRNVPHHHRNQKVVFYSQISQLHPFRFLIDEIPGRQGIVRQSTFQHRYIIRYFRLTLPVPVFHDYFSRKIFGFKSGVPFKLPR